MATEPGGLRLLHALHQSAQSLAVAPPGLLLAAHLVSIPVTVWRPRLGMGVVAVLGVLQCALAWPRTGNHLFLGVVVSVVLALLDEADAEDERLQRNALLGLVLIAFGWSGAHKLLHGLWFQGETLAWLVASRGDVAAVLRPFLSEDSVARLSGASRLLEGGGPFKLDGAWVLVSNAVWVSELAVLGLWHARLRRHAGVVLLAATWAVQAVAHEWEFALLLSNVLLPTRSRWRWLVAGGVVLLALVRRGLVQAPWWAMHAPEPT